MSASAHQLMLAGGWRLPTASITLNNVTADNIINSTEAAGTIFISGSVGGDVVIGATVTVVSNSLSYTGPVLGGYTFSIGVPGSSLVSDPLAIVHADVSASLYGNSVSASASKGYSINTGVPSVTVNIVDTSLTYLDSVSSVTFTFSEAPTGFIVSDISTTNGIISAFSSTGNPLSYTATFTASALFVGTGSVSVLGGSYTNSVGSPGVAGSDTVVINTVPVGTDWWVQNYSFSGAYPNALMNGDERGLTGVGTLVGSPGPILGYYMIHRDDAGVIIGTPKQFSVSGSPFLNYYGTSVGAVIAANYQYVNTSSSGISIAGVVFSTSTDRIQVWNCHDVDGTLLWSRYLPTPNTSSRYHAPAVRGSDGSFYLFTVPSFNENVWWPEIVKLNSSGAQQWATGILGGAHQGYGNYSIKLDAADNIHTCNLSRIDSYPTRYGVTLAKLNSSGTVLWVKNIGMTDHYPDPSHRFGSIGGFCLDLSTGSSYTVMLGTLLGVNQYICVLKVDSAGSLVWCKQLAITTNFGIYLYAGDVCMCGTDIVFGMTDGTATHLVRMNSSGAVVSSVTFQCGSLGMTANSHRIVNDGNGNLVVSGIASSYSPPVYTSRGYGVKFPYSLSKVGTWLIADGMYLTMAASSLSSSELVETYVIDNFGGGVSYNYLLDSTSMFSTTAISVATSTTDIP